MRLRLLRHAVLADGPIFAGEARLRRASANTSARASARLRRVPRLGGGFAQQAQVFCAQFDVSRRAAPGGCSITLP